MINYNETSASLFEQFKLAIAEWVKGTLGDRWEAAHIGTAGFEVHLTDVEAKPIFGHNFDVYFDGEEYFKFNYGTPGCFDPTETQSCIDFLKGLVAATSPDAAANLRKICQDFIRDHRIAL